MMLTRAKKKLKTRDEKLQSFGIVYPHLIQFLSLEDAVNLSLVCKEFYQAAVASSGPCRLLKEERFPPMIGFDKRTMTFGEDLMMIEDVTVLQLQLFQFYASTNGSHHPEQKLEISICLKNDRWEERDNRKTRDLDAPQPTRVWITIKAPPEEEHVLFSFPRPAIGKQIFRTAFIDNDGTEGGDRLQDFQEHGSEEHKDELRLLLAVVYACAKRVSNWGDDSYPSAEYLMRLFPEAIWPFFPPNFDWEADGLDRTSVREEFTYHPAPTMEAWEETVPYLPAIEPPRYMAVAVLPWYRSDSN